MNAADWLFWGIAFVSLATAPASRISVRLVGGRNEYEGRVEVYFKATDSWGTVCDRGWDDNDAHVVCRYLGLSGGKARMNAFYGEGTGDILLDGVMCAGTEHNLAACGHKGWGVHNCHHKDDAGVMCEPDIRLIGGVTGYDGRVEVYDTGAQIWGTVCGRNLDQNVSRVVCRQLGMTGGSILNIAMFDKTYGSILLGEVSCDGTEDNIMECNHSSMTNAACMHTEDLAIGCDPEIRIVGGPSPYEGRVEVYDVTTNTWGTVCDEGWDENAARVVCKYLGFAGDTAVFGGHYPPGAGPIHMSNLFCDGAERSLLDCNYDGMGRNKCQHKQDAGVKCTPPAESEQNVVCTIYRDGSVKTFSGRVILKALQRRKNFVASLGPKDQPNTNNCKFALMAYLSRDKVTWGAFSIGVHGSKPDKYYRNFAFERRGAYKKMEERGYLKRQTKPPTYLTSFPHTMTNEDNTLNVTIQTIPPNKGWILTGGSCPYSVTYRLKRKHPILMLKLVWGWHYKPHDIAGICAT